MASVAEPTPAARSTLPWAAIIYNLVIPLLAVILALIIGALVISLAKVQFPPTAAGFFEPGQLSRMGQEALSGVGTAYRGLWDGSFGRSGSISETLVAAVPLILGGLAVALGFKCGLFNIGVEGQLYAGAVAATWLGYSAPFSGLPGIVHLPLALLGGALAGAAWAFIPGLLKARTGAHEVITTIMLNYVAIFLTDYLVNFPMRDTSASSPRTPFISPAAILPRLFSDAQYRLHWGLILAILATVVIYWLLFKTTLGFEIRTVGANPFTARYAGMSIGRNFVIAMSLSGLLAGLAGAVQILGLEYNLKAGFSSGMGFDSIAVALLAKSNPFGIIPAAILWGGLRSGAGLMQVRARISIDVINIVQALIIMFVAADQIVRWLFHIRGRQVSNQRQAGFSQGWGGPPSAPPPSHGEGA